MNIKDYFQKFHKLILKKENFSWNHKEKFLKNIAKIIFSVIYVYILCLIMSFYMSFLGGYKDSWNDLEGWICSIILFFFLLIFGCLAVNIILSIFGIMGFNIFLLLLSLPILILIFNK